MTIPSVTRSEFDQVHQLTGIGKVIDFNRWGHDDEPLDYQRINAIAISNIEAVLNSYCPGGTMRGHEYVCGTMFGGPGESCSTNVNTGVGSDFSADIKWGDPIDMVAKIKGIRNSEAAQELSDFLAITPSTPTPKIEKISSTEKYESGKKNALDLWVNSDVCPQNHPYLTKKQVNTDPGIRMHRDTGQIIIPLYDENGVLWSVQRISQDGTEKKINNNGKMSGNFFTIEGERDTVYICEGFATAKTVSIITGKTAVMAVSTGNLAPVAEKVRKLYPTAALIFAADNDQDKPENPGVTAAQKACTKIGSGTVLAPPFPEGEKGDWNDYAILHGAQAAREIFQTVKVPDLPGATTPATGRVIDLAQWGAERWEGEPPQRKYLVSGRIPLGVAVMVAAMGDTGKSFILLLLAVLVAIGRGMFGCSALGGYVQEFGTAVVFTAEEDATEVHNRIAALDPDGRRFLNPGKLLVVPLPDAGGPVSLVMQTRDGLKVTPEFEMIRAQLLRIPDLKMIVFDPLQNFIQTDINADPAAGQFACAVFAQLAAETGATVILPHHMRKSAKPIETVADARDAIRGTTALVDGLRAAYALWPVADEEAKKICKSIDVKWQPNRVVAGAVVKANGKAERGISTFIREESGVLRDATAQLAAAEAKKGSADQLVALEEAIKAAAIKGQPFTKTGVNGLFDRRAELPASLQIAGRTVVWQLADELLGAGRVVKAIHTGTSKKWLDVPGGPFATGGGMIRSGA